MKCIHFRSQQFYGFCGYIILWSVSISGHSRSAAFVVTSSYKVYPFPVTAVLDFCGYIILWSVSISGHSRSTAFVVTSSYEVYPFAVTAGLRLLWWHHPMKCIHFRSQQVYGFYGYIILWSVSISGHSRSRLLWLTSSNEVYPFPVTAGLRLLWLHHPMKCIHFRSQQV